MREVGLMANISESMYSLIENGKRRPSVDVAKRIAAVLNFDWTLFFEKK
jgi:transcriptional regulator with XRE-family HTH domain